jgi:TonB family protein
MRNWLVNFSLAFAFWLSFLLIFSAVIFEKSEQLPTSISLDAAQLGEYVEARQNLSATQKLSEKSAEKLEEKIVQKKESGAPKQVAPLFNPLPQIPEELRKEAFESEAVALFHISADGLVSRVELTKPCANPRLNSLLLKSLQKWKFPSQAQDFTQEIRVGFRVE